MVFDSGKSQVNQQDEIVANIRDFSFIPNQQSDGLAIEG